MFWGQRLGSGVSLTLALLVLGIGEARPATWRLTPSVSGEVEYTDNVRGVTSGAEPDLIVTATPGFNLRGTGARLQLNLNASISREEYLETAKLGGWRANVLGAANAELYEDILFFNATTSLARRAINRNGVQATSDRDLGTNQSDVFTVRLGPTVRFRVGQWVQSETSALVTQTVFDALGQNDDPAASNTASDTMSLRLAQTFTSGRKFDRFDWRLSATESRTKRDSGGATASAGDTFTSRSVEGRVSYALERWFSPNLTVGHNSFDDTTLNGSNGRGGNFWLLGFTSQPGPRTNLSLSAGRRFNSTSYDGSFGYRLSTALNLRGTYTESVTTQQQQFATPFDFVETDEFGNLIDSRTGLPLEPGDLELDLTFGDQVFRTRSFRMGFTGTRLRNSYSLQLGLVRRDVTGTTPRETTTSSLSASIRRQLSPRLSLSLSGSVTDTSDDLAADTRSYRVNSVLNYRLGEGLTTSLALSRLDRTTSGGAGGTGGRDLTENSMVVTLRKSF